MFSDQMTEQARVWVYQSNRKFEDKEVRQIEAHLRSFIDKWTAHEKDLHGYAEVRYNRFIVLMADESHTPASGCSIDKSVHFLRAIEEKFNCRLFNRTDVAWKNPDGGIETADLEQFEKLARKGVAGPKTIVFNNLVTTKKELDQKWEVPATQSWHKQFLN